MIRKVKIYQFECDTMRYTDDTRKFLELCDGTATYTALDQGGAIDQARSAGWFVNDAYWLDRPELTCPYAVHDLPDGRTWPECPAKTDVEETA